MRIRITSCKSHFAWPSALWLLSACAGSVYAQEDVALSGYIIEGFSQPNRIAEVASQASGIVAKRIPEAGSVVRQGEAIAQLDARIPQAELAIADLTRKTEGELAAAKAELAGIQSRLESLQALEAKNHASQDEVARAQEQYDLAAAKLLSVRERQALREAEYQRQLVELDNYFIRSPFDGTLIKYLKEEGEFVGPVDPGICVVAELNQLSVEFLVPRHHRDRFKSGMKAEVLFVEANRQVAGIVYFISPYPDGETGTFAVKIRVDNSVGNLSAGERCQLDLLQNTITNTSQRLSQVRP